jgi:hypothetical protein
MAAEKIRESVIAGSWYPGHPDALRKEVRGYIDRATAVSLKGDLIGLVAPHAGYIYSGGVAGHAYKLIEDRPFERVLILAPSHRAYFKGASVYSLGGFRTPLGVVPLDRELVDDLLEYPDLLRTIPEAHAEEHSLEIQLPFLQVVLKCFRLAPIVMADQSYEFCRQLAEVLSKVCRGKNVLLVASSDLSHYHPYQQAKQLDQTVMDRVSAFDPRELARDLSEGKCEACGGGPILTVMLAARELGANKAKVLHYANSGDVTGDSSRVVGYMAAALFSNPGQSKVRQRADGSRVGVDLGLSPEEKKTLVEIAHAAILSRCLGKPMPELPIESPKLKEKRGAFVCLHKGGDLRGCIGMIEAREPLHDTIRTMAVQAAFADPRFCALQPAELDEIHIEISVLTPLERIHDPAQIEVGKHGIYVRKSYHSGLLLPQVATENGWDRGQFLEWTCRKAGLSTSAWKDPSTEIFIFSADVFD